MIRIGLFGDLHLGRSGEARWHNRLYYDRAFDVARAAVKQLNQQGLDFTVACGDLTDTGTTIQLQHAYSVLRELHMPWYALPGNHDRAGVMDRSFDRIFPASPPYQMTEGIGVCFVRERLPAGESYLLDWDGLDSMLERVAAEPPRLVVLFSHIPLLSDNGRALRHNGQYAGHFLDGEALLARLEGVMRCPVVIFCGHQHWHAITERGDALQCVTGAQIEYPMECRIVSIDQGTVTIQTLPTPVADDAMRSLDGATWVRGEVADREYIWQIPK